MLVRKRRGWRTPQITQPFELYLTLSPLVPKSAAVNAANAIARWVKKEEARLFLRDAPVFWVLCGCASLVAVGRG
jgi:hypothetical protein